MKQFKIRYLFASKAFIHTPICVIGGGSAGVNIVSQLCNQNEIFYHNIRVFEQNKIHYYQPGFTVTAGINKHIKVKKRVDEMFNNQTPITNFKVEKIIPEENKIITEDGQIYTYD